jgi:hypothetical protein
MSDDYNAAPALPKGTIGETAMRKYHGGALTLPKNPEYSERNGLEVRAGGGSIAGGFL